MARAVSAQGVRAAAARGKACGAADTSCRIGDKPAGRIHQVCDSGLRLSVFADSASDFAAVVALANCSFRRGGRNGELLLFCIGFCVVSCQFYHAVVCVQDDNSTLFLQV